ncbi:hypothetical protein J8F10_13725 [Gemmata sp. G18]|uniref:Uncharacterized protein n=1 Tax=Gemmata palustris TaxID=2822762 RepID=A0ABS5BSU6_9BACT|nr:hypothetical protein [Gemmata palustris]MBP3956345.1 hypothetical protein [Gemmata palustris]
MRWVYLLLAVIAYGACAPASAPAGPVREFVRDHRPGLIVPKPPRFQPIVLVVPIGSCDPGCPYPGGDQTALPGVPTSSVTGWLHPRTVSECPGGTCPAPRR